MVLRAAATQARYGEDRFIEVAGYALHYVEAGDGVPVLLIPGSFSTYRSWNRLVPLLRDHYRLLALDYLGTGDSDKPQSGFRYTVEEQADLIARMIPQLGMERVHLVGSSYGGAIVLNLAARYPEQVLKVVSIEGGVVVPADMPADPLTPLLKSPFLGSLFVALTRTGLLTSPVARLVAGKWYGEMTPEDRRAMREELTFNAKRANRIVWYSVGMSPHTSRDFTTEAKSIRAPVLYLYGERTDFGPMIAENLRFFRSYLPQVRLVAVAGGIHDLAFQQPGRTAELILEFLREEQR
jgi:pimeloyl-ACP methyl ester carboxylesterase